MTGVPKTAPPEPTEPRINLPGGYYLVSDESGEWFLSAPCGIWIAKFWDGPLAGKEDAELFASAMTGELAK